MKGHLRNEFLKKSIVLFFMLPLLFATQSCENRDPFAEYEILRDTVFSSPSDGVAAAQEYINYFYNKSGARTTEVSEIRHHYRLMDGFFSGSYNSYCDFIHQGRDINRELSQSTYNGVRKTWQTLYEREKNRLLGPVMDGITESDFDAFFKTQVRLLCENEFTFWEIESIDRVSLSTPSIVNDGTAKKSQGEYRVHLRGNIMGIVTKEARISIEGTIGIDESCNITANRTGYQFLQKPIL